MIRKPADPAKLLKTIDTILAASPSRFRKHQQHGSTVSGTARHRESDTVVQPFWMVESSGQERFVTRILDNVPGTVWTLDERGNFTYISPAVERLTGFSVSRIQQMGKSGWLSRVHSADEKKVRMAFKRLFKEHVPLDIAYRFECRDNRIVWFLEKTGIPCRNQADALYRVDGITTDITARILAQKRRVAFREKDVIRSFSKGVSHDLDNLLTGIADYLQLSTRTSASSQDRDRFLANALKISRRALALNRDISLLSGQDGPLEKNSLFTRVVARVVRALLEGSDIRYRVDMPRGLWPCRVDTRLMDRAIEHVLVNACEALAKKKDGLITVTLRNRSIDTGPLENESLPGIHLDSGRYVQAVIQDNGRGMDDESLCQIFDPYYSSKSVGIKNGVGLSLAMARAIVHRHGGEVAVDSRKHHGTKLIICLPAVTEESWYENRFDRG